MKETIGINKSLLLLRRDLFGGTIPWEEELSGSVVGMGI